jgi:5'-nucleotidase
MAYDLSEKLVIGIASSALFDLTDSDAVFQQQGEQAYRVFQREHEHDVLPRGVAFPFIKRMLALNELFSEVQPIEVILFSRNDPDTGQRVFQTIRAYGLGISRGAFLSGRPPHPYLDAFRTSLFLSANKEDVRMAIAAGHAAGTVLPSSIPEDEDPESPELRVAFDFDGVIADDSAEHVFQQHSLDVFQRSETEQALLPHPSGPLREFFVKLARLQQLEHVRKAEDPSYRQHIRTAIITARNAPSNERVVTTLRSWGVMADETFFLGGIEKRSVLDVFRPHIFFDDQLHHLQPSSGFIPSVHIPFGQLNRTGS